jgi:hypothetical protein
MSSALPLPFALCHFYPNPRLILRARSTGTARKPPERLRGQGRIAQIQYVCASARCAATNFDPRARRCGTPSRRRSDPADARPPSTNASRASRALNAGAVAADRTRAELGESTRLAATGFVGG